MEVRPATRLDLPAIAALHARTCAELRALAPEGFGAPLDSLPGVGDVAAKFRDMLDNSDCCLLVAEDGGRIVGILSSWREDNGDDLLEGPFLTIEYVEVQPEARGQGVAHGLIEAAEAEALARGLSRVDLLVWESNQLARELYSRLGYRTLELRMAKHLRPEPA